MADKSSRSAAPAMVDQTSEKKLRIGLIGAGAIGQTYCEVLADSATAQLVGVVDVRPEAAEAAAEATHCRAFRDIESLIHSAQPNAAVVCTPPATHADLCMELAEHGVHILCEKPLALDLTSAGRMFDAAEQNGVILTMASKFRHVADMAQARAIIASRTLGDIVLFENVFAQHVEMGDRWNSDPAIGGGGVLIDNGTHSVDIMRYLLGPLAELQVIEGKRTQRLPVEETVRVFVRTTDDVLGSIDLSWSIHKLMPAYVSIYGTLGTLEIGWQESRYRRLTDDDWTSFGHGYSKLRAFHRQVDNFTRALSGEEKLLVQPDDAIASVAVIEAAYRALKASAWEPVDDHGTRPDVIVPSNGKTVNVIGVAS